MNIEPISPVAPWLGGKRNLAKRLCAMIDATDCTTYCEPFVGMGGVFLRRTRRPKAEVINDRGRDVSNLFRILQRHYPQFLEVLRFQLTTRAEFNRLVETNPETLTDLERAARFLYLQRTAFGGKVSGRNFGVAKDRPGRFNLMTLEPMLEDLHTRLAGVVIECLDWSEFVPRYDGAGTLFYLDPPYWGCEADYGKAMFSRDDFARLAEVLRGLKGQFILSINDVPEIRDLFAWAKIEETKVIRGTVSHVAGVAFAQDIADEPRRIAQPLSRFALGARVTLAGQFCNPVGQRCAPSLLGGIGDPPRSLGLWAASLPHYLAIAQHHK